MNLDRVHFLHWVSGQIIGYLFLTPDVQAGQGSAKETEVTTAAFAGQGGKRLKALIGL